MGTRIQEIVHGTPAYTAALALRNEVLRAPLGLTMSDTDTANEERQIHIGAFTEHEDLVGCVIVKPMPGVAVVRQMAVDHNHRGLGIGRQLMLAAEAAAAERGFAIIELHARCTVVDFYRKLGYRTCSKLFVEVAIPHVSMQKILAAPS